jgi:2-polyprenyl-3-methyl-5-hydroxy-6-metoxy-1,4-benzoquinol methylase
LRPLVPNDLKVTDSRHGITLSLWRCRACSFIYADSEELSELASLYECLTDVAYEESQDVRARQMRWVLRKALAARPGARTVLDVGAGPGTLLAEAERAGLDTVGIQPSHAFVQRARAANAVDIVQGVFPHPALAGRTFDIVFLVDVVEHVPEPVELLRASANALAPGGIVLVVTPDVDSFAARKLRGRWWHFHLAHVGYFNYRSLAKAARRAGLGVARRGRAVWFFRIGYLAERAAVYIPPLAALNWVARRVPPLSWLYRLVVPLNLHDSLLVVLRRGDDPALLPTPPREPRHDIMTP